MNIDMCACKHVNTCVGKYSETVMRMDSSHWSLGYWGVDLKM